ncbi:TetR/AcrR family transcriptional regulator [Pseudonocardia sp. WMMC193]|uniref:TetR/AcrR family transcriptional regulator n=1 Tax=Pseudonocardia sp. WMMC193 TaxID=2911965 RepID=UPI001F33BA9D|nr:TetR/AcrR family transcriptional regulator [Pseudonocardia sp. WMMC193]MCF7548796.1 TetR/AcrR family transcriptional regulator [Pseudonocardia sp. WMMC193]
MQDRVKAILAGLDLWAEWPSPTQRRIVGAALESFAERGFHGTSLKHIAAGSGLSTAALYVHFASKEELLFALSRRGHALARDLVAQAAEGEPARALSVLVGAFTHWHAEHRTIARVVQYEQSALEHGHALEIAALRRDTERIVRDLLGRGVDAGVFAVSDVPGAAAAVLSLGIDVARWYGPGGRWSPHELAALYADLAARMLGVP